MKYDVIIAGGGIVGLGACLKILESDNRLKVCLLEKESGPAAHQTGNNSGVIHSGIYYKPGSLKAENCRRGYQMMVDFCRENEIAHDICGKIIVATETEELPRLQAIKERGEANGLQNIREIGPEEIRELEPHTVGLKALYVPQAGIVDYRRVAEKYAELIREKGGEIRFGHKVTGLKKTGAGVEVLTENETFEARLLINCTGLYSDKIARMSQKTDYKIIPFRGEYYKLKPESEYLVKNLIYPVPDPAFPFLGVHFTRMAKGGVEAGPNAVLAFSREGYTKSDINLAELTESLMWPGFQKVALKYWKTGLWEMYRSFSKAAFTSALQKLIPEIKSSDLETGGAGVRAQACDRTGGLIDDFLLLEEPGMIHVGNAPSPAATSSLSIGMTLAEKAIVQLQ